eukprot:2775715-Ditylum_brightwellii.AAC.1
MEGSGIRGPVCNPILHLKRMNWPQSEKGKHRAQGYSLRPNKHDVKSHRLILYSLGTCGNLKAVSIHSNIVDGTTEETLR